MKIFWYILSTIPFQLLFYFSISNNAEKINSNEEPINNYILSSIPIISNNFTFYLPFKCVKLESTYRENPKNKLSVEYPNYIIENLEILIYFDDITSFDFKIRDLNKKRYEVPSKGPLPKDLINDTNKCICLSDIEKYKIHNNKYFKLEILNNIDKIILNPKKFDYKVIIQKIPFSLTIIRKFSKENIFNNVNSSFIFTDKYIEFSNNVNTNFIMGMGERNFKSKLEIDHIYTLWSRDEAHEIEDGIPPGKNSYGYQPVYLLREKSGFFNIGFFRSSNAMDFIIKENHFLIKTVKK